MMVSHQGDPIKRARLRWRARRGLLENDLILTHFLDQYEMTLTDDEVEALTQLMTVSDNDLMQLFLGKGSDNVSTETADILKMPGVQGLLLRIVGQDE